MLGTSSRAHTAVRYLNWWKTGENARSGSKSLDWLLTCAGVQDGLVVR